MIRRRLDRLLVDRELASSRAAAQRLLDQGRVLVDGLPASKPAALVDEHATVTLAEESRAWASRGAHKLLGALDDLGVVVAGRGCLDAGASTGGFTDVLLARGARRVVAVDVGYGQLLWRLRADPRVVVLDRTNARALEPGDVPPPPPELITADLSFISLTKVLPSLAGLLGRRGPAPPALDPSRDASGAGELLLLVKPQFEVGRARVGRGGVVRDPQAWRGALTDVAAAGLAEGLGVRAAAPSRLLGPAGNVEFFVHLLPGATPADDWADAAVASGLALRDGG